MRRFLVYVGAAIALLLVAAEESVKAYGVPGFTIGPLTCEGTSCSFTEGFDLVIGDDELLIFGDNTDFWLVYDEAVDNAFEIQSTNCDGVGTDCTPMKIVSGTDDSVWTGNATFAGNVYTGDGTNSLPSRSFASDPDTGTYLSASNEMSFARGTVQQWRWGSGGYAAVGTGTQIQMLAAPAASGTPLYSFESPYGDYGLGIDPTNAVELMYEGIIAQSLSGSGVVFSAGDKGATKGLYSTTPESLIFANDASKTTTTSQLPLGAFVFSVTGRVTTALTGCTSVDVGDGATQNLFADDLSIADETVFSTTVATASFFNPITSAAGEITVTANGSSCTAGVIAVQSHYLHATAATAD
jgi:hypothetical protein